MFCKHKWKMLSEKTTESQFEHSMNTAYKYSNAIKLPHQLCDAERKVIQILSCEKCGKLKKFVETI